MIDTVNYKEAKAANEADVCASRPCLGLLGLRVTCDVQAIAKNQHSLNTLTNKDLA